MKRREFLALTVGMVAGSMLKPIEPLVSIPRRPRVGPGEKGMEWGNQMAMGFFGGLERPVAFCLVDAVGNRLDCGGEMGDKWTYVVLADTDEDA